VSKSFRELGLDIDDFSLGSRASIDGQVPADLFYSEWIEGQDAATQTRALGDVRGAHLAAGHSFESLFAPDGSLIPIGLIGTPGLTHPPPAVRSKGIANLEIVVLRLEAPDEAGQRAAEISTVCKSCGGFQIAAESAKGDRAIAKCAACGETFGTWGAVKAEALRLTKAAQEGGM
jgi:hypothetical protein